MFWAPFANNVYSPRDVFLSIYLYSFSINLYGHSFYSKGNGWLFGNRAICPYLFRVCSRSIGSYRNFSIQSHEAVLTIQDGVGIHGTQCHTLLLLLSLHGNIKYSIILIIIIIIIFIIINIIVFLFIYPNLPIS